MKTRIWDTINFLKNKSIISNNEAIFQANNMSHIIGYKIL